VAQVGGFVDDAVALEFVAAFLESDNGFDDVIQVTMGVDTAG